MGPKGSETNIQHPDAGPFLTHLEVSNILDPKSARFEATIENIKAVLDTVETSLQKNDLSINPTGTVEMSPMAEGISANPFYKTNEEKSIYTQLRLLPKESAVYGIVKSALIIPPTHPIWSSPELIETLITTCLIADACLSSRYMLKSVVGLFTLFAINVAPNESYLIEHYLVPETPVRKNILKMIFFINPHIIDPMLQIAGILDQVQSQRDSKKISNRTDVLASYIDAMTSQLPIRYERTDWPEGSAKAGSDIFERSISEFLAIITNARRQSQGVASKSLIHGRQFPPELYEQIKQLEVELNTTGITYENFVMLLLKLPREKLLEIKNQNSQMRSLAPTPKPLLQKP